MNDKGFEDLDKMAGEQKAKAALAAGRKNVRGRYLDMVHPNSDMRPPARGYSVGKEIAEPKEVRGPEKMQKPEVEETDFESVEMEELADESMAGRGLKESQTWAEDWEEKAPNANNYSLGGRSPFMIDTKVDKRPLGRNVPEGFAGTVRSTKNVYSQRTPTRRDAEEMPEQPMVTVAPQKKSGWLWALVTLLIIAAGGGLGALAYVIFANQ